MKILGLLGGMSWEIDGNLLPPSERDSARAAGWVAFGKTAALVLRFRRDRGAPACWRLAGRRRAPVGGCEEAGERWRRSAGDLHQHYASHGRRSAGSGFDSAYPYRRCNGRRDEARRRYPPRAARHRLHHGAGFLQGPAGEETRHDAGGARCRRPYHGPPRHLRRALQGRCRVRNRKQPTWPRFRKCGRQTTSTASSWAAPRSPC